jgi:hypothetical protein
MSGAVLLGGLGVIFMFWGIFLKILEVENKIDELLKRGK